MKVLSLTNSSAVALVDDEDFDTLACFRFKLNSHGYVVRTIHTSDDRRTYICLHRQIMNAQRGQYVDHIDNDKLNNSRSNLRFCSQSQNLANRRLHKNNSSGFKGVTFQHGRYHARIQKDERDIHLGFYDDLRSAALGYDFAATLLFPGFARLNLPDTETPPNVEAKVLTCLARHAAKLRA
jgi:hypothetical protein